MVGLIHIKDLSALLPCRGKDGWMCHLGPAPDTWWIKGAVVEIEQFSKLPFISRWTEDEGGQLFRSGHQVPEYRVDGANWLPLATLLTVGSVKKTAPAMAPYPVGFGLVPCDANHPVTALVCQWAAFVSWAESVLAQRIECLKFALADDGRCIVSGTPLPGIDGVAFYQTGRLWIPAGYSLPEFVWPDLIGSAIQLAPSDSAMVQADGEWEIIRDRDWVPASRQNIRSNNNTTGFVGV